MKLILIRHGDAGAYTHPDSERALSDLGRQQANSTGQWLASHYKIHQCISSPYVRARQTADIVISPQDTPKISVCNAITPNDESMAGLNAIQGLIDDDVILQDKTVAVVCHMNIIAQMAALLTNTTPEPFALAQARVYELSCIDVGQAVEIERFTP